MEADIWRRMQRSGTSGEPMKLVIDKEWSDNALVRNVDRIPDGHPAADAVIRRLLAAVQPPMSLLSSQTIETEMGSLRFDEKRSGEVTMTVLDLEGNAIRSVNIPPEAFRAMIARAPRDPVAEDDQGPEFDL